MQTQTKISESKETKLITLGAMTIPEADLIALSKQADLFQLIREGDLESLKIILPVLARQKIIQQKINEIRKIPKGFFAFEEVITPLSEAVKSYLQARANHQEELQGQFFEIILLLIQYRAKCKSHCDDPVQLTLKKYNVHGRDKYQLNILLKTFDFSARYAAGEIENFFGEHYLECRQSKQAEPWLKSALIKQRTHYHRYSLYTINNYIEASVQRRNTKNIHNPWEPHSFEALRWIEISRSLPRNRDIEPKKLASVGNCSRLIVFAVTMAESRETQEVKNLNPVQTIFVNLQLGNISHAQFLMDGLDQKQVDPGLLPALHVIKSVNETKEEKTPLDFYQKCTTTFASFFSSTQAKHSELSEPFYIKLLAALNKGAQQGSKEAIDYLAMYTAFGPLECRLIASHYVRALPIDKYLVDECNDRISQYQTFHEGLHHLYGNPQDLNQARVIFESIIQKNPEDIDPTYLNNVKLKLTDCLCKLANTNKTEKKNYINNALQLYNNLIPSLDSFDPYTRIEFMDQLIYLAKIAEGPQKTSCQNLAIDLIGTEIQSINTTISKNQGAQSNKNKKDILNHLFEKLYQSGLLKDPELFKYLVACINISNVHAELGLTSHLIKLSQTPYPHRFYALKLLGDYHRKFWMDTPTRHSCLEQAIKYYDEAAQLAKSVGDKFSHVDYQDIYNIYNSKRVKINAL